MKDIIIRFYLGILNLYRYIFRVTKYGKFKIPSNYELVFHEKFDTLTSFKDNWDIDFSEWQYSPTNPTNWTDSEQIKETINGIELNAEHKPKYFKEIDKVLPSAYGLIRSKADWKYGIFKIIAKAPTGKHLWWALWLSGRWSWPPEIDIVESWSKNTLNSNKNRSLTTNAHYGYPEHKDYGSYRHRLPFEVNENFTEYLLWWEKDFIKIYYNGYLVFKTTNKEILTGMFESQRIILNNSTDEGFYKCLTPLIINNVKVYQTKK